MSLAGAVVLRPAPTVMRYVSSGSVSANRITTWFWSGRASTEMLPGTIAAPPLRTIAMLPSVSGLMVIPGLNRSVICCGASVSVLTDSPTLKKGSSLVVAYADTRSNAITRRSSSRSRPACSAFPRRLREPARRAFSRRLNRDGRDEGRDCSNMGLPWKEDWAWEGRLGIRRLCWVAQALPPVRKINPRIAGKTNAAPESKFRGYANQAPMVRWYRFAAGVAIFCAVHVPRPGKSAASTVSKPKSRISSPFLFRRTPESRLRPTRHPCRVFSAHPRQPVRPVQSAGDMWQFLARR